MASEESSVPSLVQLCFVLEPGVRGVPKKQHQPSALRPDVYVLYPLPAPPLLLIVVLCYLTIFAAQLLFEGIFSCRYLCSMLTVSNLQ